MGESIFEYLAARIQEPSTWVSLGAFFTGIGWQVAPDYWQAIAGIGMGLGGFLGTVMRERKKTTPTEIKDVVKETVTPAAIKPTEK